MHINMRESFKDHLIFCPSQYVLFYETSHHAHVRTHVLETLSIFVCANTKGHTRMCSCTNAYEYIRWVWSVFSLNLRGKKTLLAGFLFDDVMII